MRPRPDKTHLAFQYIVKLRNLVNTALGELEEAGAKIRRVSLPHTHYAIPCYYVLAPAEASSNLSRYDGVGYGVRCAEADLISMYQGTRSTGLGIEVKRRIMLGTYALSAGYYDEYYGTAQRARRILCSWWLNEKPDEASNREEHTSGPF